MIYLITDRSTPRLEYATELLGQYLWGSPIQIVLQKDLPSERNGIWLNYSLDPIPGTFQLFRSNFLFETHLPQSFAPEDEGRQLFPAPSSLSVNWNWDILATLVWVCTEAEYYVTPYLDAFGRYEQSVYPSHHWGLAEAPYLAQAAQDLKIALRKYFRYFPTGTLNAGYVLTWDIDFPWRYRHKPLHVKTGAAIRDLAQGNWPSAFARWQTTTPDPFDTFDQIARLSPPEHTHVFWLIERRSPHDSWFTYRTAAYQALIRRMQGQGFQLGVHPSFRSSESKNWLQAEVAAFDQICGTPTRTSRQHFLRYRTPETYRWLIEAGIRVEYSPYRHQTGGFPMGMVRPFPWFDLARNEPTPLLLHPTHLMDRTLLSHLQLDPSQALERFESLKKTTQAYQGCFTLLLHNDSLSEVGEWKGWQATILQMIQALT